MNIGAIVSFFTNPENIKTILAFLGAAYGLALLIVKLTPTPKDDEILSKVYNFVHKIIGILGVKK